MLDAPVSGGDVGAINGTLSIMVGGDQSVFDECLPVFEAMGKNINLIGGNGAGQTPKLCNQIAVSVNNLAMAEALMLAAASDMGAVLAELGRSLSLGDVKVRCRSLRSQRPGSSHRCCTVHAVRGVRSRLRRVVHARDRS